MPCQGIEMHYVFDSHVKTIMNARTFDTDITKEEVTAAYSPHAGVLLYAMRLKHRHRVGRLFWRPLPMIRFWCHFYCYLERYHLFWLSSYVVGRKKMDAWEKVIQAYYFRNYDLNKPWRTQSRNIRSPMPPFRILFPVESEWSAQIGCSQDNDELDAIYKHFLTSDDEDTHLPNGSIHSQFWRMNIQLQHLNTSIRNSL